jgi:hypothetical protein
MKRRIMDTYIPPLIAIAAGIIVVLLCFLMRIPFFIVGLLSIAMAIYVLQDHYYRYSSEYKSVMSPAFFRENASTLIVVVVIIMSLGFLLLRFGPKTITSSVDARGNKVGFLDKISLGFSGLFKRSDARSDPRYSLGYGTGYDPRYR